MEFRLTCEGPLYSSQPDDNNRRGDRRADHKHHLRRVFHQQLKRLWGSNKALHALDHLQDYVPQFYYDDRSAAAKPPNSISELAAAHSTFGFNFVPLVTLELDLLCGIDVLFLRPDKPGGVVWAGDLDNRLKTLLDALRVPEAGERYDRRSPQEDEAPLFVLLQDDKLISKVSIDTDQLLEPVSTGQGSEADVRLVITVTIKPYQFALANMHFA